ncbi:unnamed protein product [Boreogadus saida]
MSHGSLPPLARAVLGVSPPSPDLKHHLPLRVLPVFGKMDLQWHEGTHDDLRLARVAGDCRWSGQLDSACACPQVQTDSLLVPGYTLTLPLKRRHSSCGVCRLKFNSEMQVSSHYSGTKHGKRLKALDSMETKKTWTLEPLIKKKKKKPDTEPCSSELLDRAASPSTREEVECLGSTGVATLKGEGPDPSTAFPCPPGPPAPLGGGEGPTAVGMEIVEEMKAAGEETEREEDKAIRLLYCSLCKVAVNSASQLQAHNSGTKHSTMLEARRGGGAIKSFPRSGVKAKYAAAAAGAGPTMAALDASTGLQNMTFHCQICDVHVNSETQLKQHISSRRHKDRAAGKPAKPKFSPYPPTPREHGLQAVCLALRKEPDLAKPLTSSTCLLHRHLSAASVAAMVPFHLRPVSTSSPALFKNQQLQQALLHPAVTPICSSTHTPLLFSPF